MGRSMPKMADSSMRDLPMMPQTASQPPQDSGLGPLDPSFSLTSYLLGKLEQAAKATEPYTAAPLRAGIGDLQRGGDLGSAAQSAWAQMKAGEDLPSTPRGEDIAYKGMTSSGVDPRFALPTAKAVGPLVSGGLDLLNIPVGGEVATKGILNAADAIRPALETAGNLGADGVFNLGSLLAGVDTKRAMKATEGLSAGEQFFPGTKYIGPLKSANKELNALRYDTGKMSATVPDSGYGVAPAIEGLEEVKNKPSGGSAKTQNLIDKLQNYTDTGKSVPSDIGDLVNLKKDLSVGQLDELLHNVDDAQWTEKGNKRILDPQLKPGIGQARGVLSDLTSQVPAGQELLDKRAKVANLLEAKTGGASDWRRNIAHVLAKPSFGLSEITNPATYHRIVGAARLPKQYGEYGISLLKNISESDPLVAEGLARTGVQTALRKKSPWTSMPVDERNK